MKLSIKKGDNVLVLTGKDAGVEERVAMCGVPHHAVENYIEKKQTFLYKILTSFIALISIKIHYFFLLYSHFIPFYSRIFLHIDKQKSNRR